MKFMCQSIWYNARAITGLSKRKSQGCLQLLEKSFKKYVGFEIEMYTLIGFR